MKIELSKHIWTAPFSLLLNQALLQLTLVHCNTRYGRLQLKQLSPTKKINIHHRGIQSHEDVSIYYANPFALLPIALNTL